MNIPAKLQEQLDDLALFPDRQGRIEALISYGEDYIHPPTDVVARDPETRVPGCESEAYVVARENADGTLKFNYAVDNPQGISAMALSVILEKGLSGAPLTEVVAVKEEMIYEVFGTELSMGKSMGLMGMVKMSKHEAQKRLG